MSATSAPRDRASMSDDELLALINAGDVEAGMFALEARYGGAVFGLVQSLVMDSHVAQDVVQETFMKVFMKSHLYRPGTNFRAWLMEIARNQAVSARRCRQRGPRPLSSLSPPSYGSDNGFLGGTSYGEISWDLEEKEIMAAFRDAVAKLPERNQTVFRKCVMQGFPYHQVAKGLGIPTGTVAIRIMRARKRLHRSLAHLLGRLRRPPACFT